MKSIDLAVTVDRPVPEAQAQILDSVDHRLRARGLARRPTANAVEYRPKFVMPAIVWVVRRLAGEHVTFTFEQRGPVTEMRATGRLRDRVHAELTEALGGS